VTPRGCWLPALEGNAELYGIGDREVDSRLPCGMSHGMGRPRGGLVRQHSRRAAARPPTARIPAPPTPGREAAGTSVDQTYFRKGFGLKDAIADAMAAYHSGGGRLRPRPHARSGRPDVPVGEEFGFCYGVDRCGGVRVRSAPQVPREAHLPRRRDHPQPTRESPDSKSSALPYLT